MYGYKAQIDSLPQMVFACETTLSDYAWKNNQRGNILEIAYSYATARSFILRGKEHMLQNSVLSCVWADESIESSCQPGMAVTIISVAAELSDASCTFCEITEAVAQDDSCLVLPLFCDNLTPDVEVDLMNRIYNVIRLNSQKQENNRVACASEFLMLLYEIDRLTRNRVMSQRQKDKDYYIRKADYIMETKYAEKITLASVAAELNISPVYLSSVYKAHKNINFSDYLLRVRMKHAQQLLLDPNIPTSKVTYLCGFRDESYFRKKFKAFFGMNIGECRKIKNGLTLYHAAPVREKER